MALSLSAAPATRKLSLPDPKIYDILKGGSGKQEVASTMAFVRLLKELIKDKHIGKRIVPIIPDEARTFGLDSIFPSAKIFNTLGQNYLPVDANMMLSYREAQAGQIMHTGINELVPLAPSRWPAPPSRSTMSR